MIDTVSGITDTELFQRIKKGGEKAFDILFLKYYPLLCAYAKQFVCIDDAQEIVQDVMIWLWENREMQNIEYLNKNYLFKSVKNRCFTLINRNEIKQRVFAIVHEKLQNNFEDVDFYIIEELTQNIDAALKRLPDTYREAFLLNRYQNKTYQEIATQLNVSPKTVDYRIQQALKQLRVDLKDYLPLFIF